MMKTGLAVTTSLTLSIVGISTTLATPALTTLVTCNASTGFGPVDQLIADSNGNLYGTAETGGPGGDGTVFELAAGTHAFSTLAAFNGSNGEFPKCRLAMDASGNLFGTTSGGGANGDGTIFEIPAHTNQVTTLASFNSNTGTQVECGLTFDARGNLYGTASYGGSNNDGTVFELAAGSTTITPLVNMNSSNANPNADLLIDASGNLFGTALQGGTNNKGTVFEVAAGTSKLTTLVNFNSSSGAGLLDGLVADDAGDMFGVTYSGGPHGSGTIFEITAESGTFSTLATFTGIIGAGPDGDLIFDNSGDLFGTTQVGGGAADGTIFELAAGSNTITLLHTFDGNDGSSPDAGLVSDGSGNLYGTTSGGGSLGNGTIFQLTGTGFVVPEPSCLALTTFGCVGLLRRRKMRTSGESTRG